MPDEDFAASPLYQTLSPAPCQAAFDGAIYSLGDTGPLWQLSMKGDFLLQTPSGEVVRPARIDDRVEWVAPA